MSLGIVAGMDDGTLNPAGNATRAQIATILMRFCEGVAKQAHSASKTFQKSLQELMFLEAFDSSSIGCRVVSLLFLSKLW